MLYSILTSPCHFTLTPARPTIRFANFIILSIRFTCVKLQFPHTEIQKRTWGRIKAFISGTIVFVGMIWRRRLRRINNPMHLPVITSTCLFQVRQLSIVKPKLRIDDLMGTSASKIRMLSKFTRLNEAFEPNTITCVFATLSARRFQANHSASLRSTTWSRVVMPLMSAGGPDTMT